MKAFSFIGQSGSGKTRLIARLVPALKKRGFAVAVIKHCPHGFSLDREGTDSSKFFKAGASGVGLISPRQMAVVQRTRRTTDFRIVAERHLPGVDIVLIEGGRAGKGIPKIEVLGEDEGLRPAGKNERRVAVVSDREQGCRWPVFRHSQVNRLATFLEKI